MSKVYIIRRGKVRGAGDYCGGAWSADQRDAFRFTRRRVDEYVPSMVGGDYRAVRLLPAGTMRARRRATVRELRAQAARLRRDPLGWEDSGGWNRVAAHELEARAAELENER